ncbi:MAG: glycosyltransferase family 9 protein [Candidatus Omnitrophota bacterium]|jgi:heptosyltransferase-2
MEIKAKAIKNILIVRNDRFGEFLLNIPAMRALKEKFGQARLIAVVNPDVKELARLIPFIDEIIEWRQKGHPLSEKLRLISLLKNKQIDIAVILNPSKEFNLISWLSGIPVRIGYNRKWGFLLTHKIEDRKYLGDKHEIEYNLELVRLIGANTDDKTLPLAIEDDIIKNLAEEFAIQDSNNLVALHPWTSDPIKQWPVNNFRELAEKLVRELDIKLIIIGGRTESAESERFFSGLSGKIINLAGKTSLRQLAAFLKKCKLLISCDSGPVHLASCAGIPVVAIFRNDLPEKSSRRWGPRSPRSAVIEKSKLSDITVDEVFNRSREVFLRR